MAPDPDKAEVPMRRGGKKINITKKHGNHDTHRRKGEVSVLAGGLVHYHARRMRGGGKRANKQNSGAGWVNQEGRRK